MIPSSQLFWQEFGRAIGKAMRESRRAELRFVAIDDIVDISASHALVTAKAWMLGNAHDRQFTVEIDPGRPISQLAEADWRRLLYGHFTLEADTANARIRIRGILQTEGHTP